MQTPTRPLSLVTYSHQLRDGRTITIREMTGKDLVYLEEELADVKSDARKSLMLMAHLNVGDTKLTYEDMEDLPVKDFNELQALIAKANGVEEDPKK